MLMGRQATPMGAEAVIDPDFLEEYRDHYRTVYGHLALAKNSLFLMEKIDSFPFDLFTHENRRTFWTLAAKALFDEVILALWLLISEEEKKKGKRGYFAVDNFGKRVLDVYLKKDSDDLRQQIKAKLDEFDFDTRIEPLKKKISDIRNNHVAHLDFDTQMGFREGESIEYRMTIPEMREALNIAHELFVIFSFDGNPSLDYWEYAARPDAKEYYTDIDDLLTFVTSQSIQILHFGTSREREVAQTHLVGELSEDQEATVQQWKYRADKLFGKDE